MAGQRLRTARASAPGKIILHGEHAVVHGTEAVAAALDLRTTVTATPTYLDGANSTQLHLVLADLQLDFITDLRALVETPSAAVTSFAEPDAAELHQLQALPNLDQGEQAMPHDYPHVEARLALLYLTKHILRRAQMQGIPLDLNGCRLRLEVTSRLPIGAGLGSSAALCVATAAALLLAVGHCQPEELPDHLDDINSWALVGEQVVHGNPSGLDNTISSFGGAVRFKKGSFNLLQPFPLLNILVVESGHPKSTRAQIAKVTARLQEQPPIFRPMLESINALSLAAQETYAALASTQAAASMLALEETLQMYVDVNQQLLAGFGVSHPALDEICSLARSHGTTGKLTGGGGGGCAFIFIPSAWPGQAVASLQNDLEAAGYRSFRTKLGAAGAQGELLYRTLSL